MSTKYERHIVRFSGKKDNYRGRILSNSLSPRILNNSRMSGFIIKLENIIQSWIDEVTKIKLSLNYRSKNVEDIER